MNLLRATSLDKDGLLHRLAWAPVAALIVLMGLFWAYDPSCEVYAHPNLARAMNFLSKTVASGVIAILVGRGFFVSGRLGLLLLGCGAGIWGTTSMIASAGFTNMTVTIANLGALTSGICHLLGSLAIARSRNVRSTGAWLAAGYIGAMMIVGSITLVAAEGWLPVFFVNGAGGTPVQNFVMGSTIAMFVLTAMVLLSESGSAGSPFTRWYSHALLLIAAGLLGLMIETTRFTRLDWTARVSQNLGGIYMLIAVFTSVRETGTWGISLGEALRESEERFRLFMNNSPTIAWIKDEAGRHLYINKTYENRFQISQQKILGKCDEDLESAERAAKCRSTDAKAIAMNSPIEYLETYKNPDGSFGDWIVIKFPFTDATGGLYVAGIGLDVTDRRRAEEELKNLNRSLEERVHERTCELRDTVQQLQVLAQKLTQAEEKERGRLAEILHDDVQQILVAAKMHLGRASTRVRDNKEATELIGQTDALLDEAIMKTRKMSHEISPPYFAQLDLADSLGWLSDQMKTKYEMNVRVEADEAIQMDEPVKMFLFRAAQELLFNAVKHAGVDEAHVDLRRVDEMIDLTVSDCGAGFDPKPIGRGGRIRTGLGLFSIQERIGVMGGRLTIDSKPGEGSRFKMTVPATAKPTGTPKPPNQSIIAGPEC